MTKKEKAKKQEKKQKKKHNNKKENNFEKFRKFLEDNKIIIEAVNVVVFTFLGVVISIAQCGYMREQNVIDKESQLPHFFVELNRKYDEQEEKYLDEVIMIFNKGAIAYEVDTEHEVIFDIDVFNKKTFESNNYHFRIYGYLFHTSSYSTTSEVVKEIGGYNNNIKRFNIEKDLMEMGAANDLTINMTVLRYIKLSYVDMFDQSHVEYYLIDKNNYANSINPKNGNQLFSEFHTYKTMDLDDDEIVLKIFETIEGD